MKTRLANSVDPDETAHGEPFHLGLHCFQKNIFVYNLKGLREIDTLSRETTVKSANLSPYYTVVQFIISDQL